MVRPLASGNAGFRVPGSEEEIILVIEGTEEGDHPALETVPDHCMYGLKGQPSFLSLSQCPGHFVFSCQGGGCG